MKLAVRSQNIECKEEYRSARGICVREIQVRFLNLDSSKKKKEKTNDNSYIKMPPE